MFGSEVGGGFPDEVGDVARAEQALQRCGIHVGTEREPVIGAGQAGPGAGGFVGLAVFQDVGQLIGEWIVDGRTSLDLHPLRLERFSEQQALAEANVI